MAIHVSDRNPSKCEYEDRYRDIYRDVKMRMERIPKRRWETVAKPVLLAMNRSFDMVMRIEEDPIAGTKTAADKRYELIVESQRLIKAVEKPLWVWWNISALKDDVRMQDWKKRADLCEAYSTVLRLLHDMQQASSRYNPQTDKGLTTMRYFTEKEINNAIFLRKLRELHQMTHNKHIRLSKVARDAESDHLVQLANAAWYYAGTGNQYKTFIPNEAKARKELFSMAVSCLKRMERPLHDLLADQNFSNREMEEWIDLLDESTRLMISIQKG